MKPIKLVMNAFGPYKEKAEINFLKLKDKSLFLITGPTGAGKSTIFDAITFALYGKSNLEGKGYERDSKNFKSDFADLDEESYVEFDFEVKNKPYSIKRYPAQEVKKLRGEGFREKSEEAILTYKNHNGDTVIVEKIIEVREEVENIIGLTVEQFRQIMMIPQGQFKKVISSDTKERKEILQKLFDISICSKVQEGLKNRAKEKEREIKSIEKRIDENFNILNKEVYKEENTDENILSRLSFFIDIKNRNETKLDELKAKLKALDIEISKLNQKKGFIEIVNSLIEDRDRKVESLNIELLKENEFDLKEQKVILAEKASLVKEKEQEYINVLEEIKVSEKKVSEVDVEIRNKDFELKFLESQIELGSEERKEKDRLTIEIDRLSNLDESAKQLDSLEQEIKKIEKEISKILTTKDELIKKNSFLEKEIINLEDIEKDIKENNNRKESVAKKLKDIEINNTKLENIDDSFRKRNTIIKEYKSIKGNIEEKEKTIVELEEKFKEIEEVHRDINDKYNKQIIYRLQKELKEDESCPVCGSKTHNNIKRIHLDDLVTEEDLNIVEEELSEVKNRLDKVRTSCIEEKAKCKEIKNNGKDLTEEILKKCEEFGILLEEDEKTSNLKEKYLVYYMNLKQEESRYKKDLKEIVLQGENLEILKNDNRKKEIEFRKNQENLQFLKEERLELSIKCNELSSKYMNEKEKIFDDITIKENFYDAYTKLLEEKKSRFDEIICKIEKEDNKKEELKKTIDEKTGEKMVFIKSIKENKSKESAKKAQYLEEITSCGFENEKSYKENYLEKDIVKKLSEEIQAYKDNIKELNRSVEDLNKRIGNNKTIDIKLLQKDIDESLEEKSKIEDEKNSIMIVNQRIIEYTNKINNDYEKNKLEIEYYEKLKDLSDVANRNNKKNISFEAYVLSTYLDEILEFTNQRFNKMTDGRYKIFRKKNISNRTSESGLDLEVKDYYSSKKRDISTLSGGESFKASLSMALGLSDVVKMYSGGVGLDTIFIDEGFGTLDSESLDMAIDTLIEIQNQGRLVGIISHVEELKERIPDKIIIESGSEGSSLKDFY